jgi:hypothetical protein
MNQNRLFFVQIQTLSSSMHHKWKEVIDLYAKQPKENHTGPTLDKNQYMKG